LDGNHLPASEKRLKPLRDFRGAALPGQSLVVYAPELGLVVDVLPAEVESEVRSLGRPRAALLAFGVAVLAYNVLSVVKSAVEASHDLEAANMQVSTYYIAAEVKFTYGGMMVMVEPEDWSRQEAQ
jgi:hypothetical protein